MEIQKRQPTVKASAETFADGAWFDVIARGEAPSRRPGHRGPVTEVRAGDTIWTPPGEWHWHGAASDRFMTHLAIWEGPGDGPEPETEWGEHVTDAEYGARTEPGA